MIHNGKPVTYNEGIALIKERDRAKRLQEHEARGKAHPRKRRLTHVETYEDRLDDLGHSPDY